MEVAEIDKKIVTVANQVDGLQKRADAMRSEAVSIGATVAALRIEHAGLYNAVTALDAGTANDVRKDQFAQYLAQFTNIENVGIAVVAAMPVAP